MNNEYRPCISPWFLHVVHPYSKTSKLQGGSKSKLLYCVNSLLFWATRYMPRMWQ